MALTRAPAPRPRVETAIVPPDGVFLTASGGGIALSPDGLSIAFIGHRAGEKRVIWVRDLATAAVRSLAGTEDSSHLFWSPDGKSIGFLTPNKLQRISVAGGSSETVAEGPINGGTWASSGEIVYSTAQSIFRVAASGGTASKLVDLPNRTLTSPTMLPDGQRFLFTSIRGSRDPDSLYLGSLDGTKPKTILAGVYSNTAYVPSGMILYVRDGDLRAQPVDPKTLEPHGDPIRIAARVQYDPDSQRGLFTVSETGSLAYVTGEGAGKTELAWVARDGKDLQIVAPPAMYYTPRLSHDGKRIVVDMSEQKTASGDIWVFDLQRNASTRLTYDPANESCPIWTPDDRNVIFFSEKKGHLDIYQRSSAGIGNDETVLEDATAKLPGDLSPDGRWLAYSVTASPERESDIWMLDRQSGKAKPFLNSPFMETAPQFSPDGGWVAYTSNESGRDEIYVLQFPESTGKWIVSRGGGRQPAWSADGTQIYYVSSDQKLMSVAVTLGASFDSTTPVALFDMPVRLDFPYRQYCVSNDGSRFLLNRRVGESERGQVTFVQNWTTSIER